MPRTNDEITRQFLALLDSARLNHWQAQPEVPEQTQELTYRERLTLEAPRCAAI